MTIASRVKEHLKSHNVLDYRTPMALLIALNISIGQFIELRDKQRNDYQDRYTWYALETPIMQILANIERTNPLTAMKLTYFYLIPHKVSKERIQAKKESDVVADELDLGDSASEVKI